MAVGTLAAALLLGTYIGVAGISGGADTTAGESGLAPGPPTTLRPVPSTPSKPRAQDSSSSKGPLPQRFAWAPDTRASAYHVELFRDGSKVFEQDTKHAAITIPARWVLAGEDHTLAAGMYRWYVWPVISRRRAAKAIVQATLTVPPR